MNYFRINLNKLEDPSIARRLKVREIILFLAITLFIGLFAALTGHVKGKLDRKNESFSQAARQLEMEINQLEQSENYISESEVRDLYRLNNQRILWTANLETVTKTVGPHVALTCLRYRNGKLNIEGIARVRHGKNQFNVISGFISRLKADSLFMGYFPQVEFLSSKRQEYEEQAYIEFELLCHGSRKEGVK